MILRPLLCQITFMFLQGCQTQYAHYDYQVTNYGNYFQNDAHQPIQYQDNFEIYNSPVNLRSREESSCSSRESTSTEECLCSCNECYNPKVCCSKYCNKCRTTDGYTYKNIDHAPYHTLPQSNVMVVQYAVPVMIFTLNTVKLPQTTGKTTKSIDSTTTGKYSPNESIPTTDIIKPTEEIKTVEESQTVKPTEENQIATFTDNYETSFEEVTTITNSGESLQPNTTPNTRYETDTEKTDKVTNMKIKLKSKTTQLTKSMKKFTTKPKRTLRVKYTHPTGRNPVTKPTKPNAKIVAKTTKKKLKHISAPSPKEEVDYQSQSSLEYDNMTSEYYEYPDDVIKQKINDTKCKNAANCYSRNWNRNGDPVKLYIETKSSLMPLVRLRPTLEKTIQQRSMDQTPNYKIKQRSKVQSPKYRLRALNDKFAKKLINELKNKQVLVLQNNI